MSTASKLPPNSTTRHSPATHQVGGGEGWALTLRLGWALIVLVGGLLASPVKAALDINMTVNGSNIVTVGDFRSHTISYSWASLTESLANGVIEVQLPVALDHDQESDVNVYGSAHTASAVYDPNTRKITFTFVDPLPSGSSGSLQFDVRFPQGTADGTLAVVDATSSGTGQPNDSATVTLEADSVAVTNLLMQTWPDHHPLLGQDMIWYTYIQNVGTTDYLNPVVVEQLPLGATFVSANSGGTYNAGASTVTWNDTTIHPGGQRFYSVVVRYDSPTFATGQWVTSESTATGTDSLSAPVNLSAEASVQIVAPNPAATIDKWDSADPMSLRGAFVYMFWIANLGNVPLTNYTCTDNFPKEFIPQYIYPGGDNSGATSSTINIWYKTTANATWQLLPGSPFVTVGLADPYVDVSSLGLAPGEVVSSVKYQYASVPVGFDASWRPRVLGHMGDPATGHDRTGVAITGLPKTISNTLDVAYDYNGVTHTGSDVETTQIIGESPAPLLSLDSPYPTAYIPLQEITWRARIENDWSASEPLIDPVFGTLLPETLEFVPGSVSTTGDALMNPSVTITDNYNGTGRQLVKFSFSGNQPPTGSAYNGQTLDWVAFMTFETRVKSGATAGVYALEYALLNAGNTFINDGLNGKFITDVEDIDGDTNTTEQLMSSGSADFGINTSTAIDSVLWVKGELDSEFNRYPDAGFTNPGGTMQYKLIVSNPGNIALTGIRVMDILPFVGDVGVILHTQARESNFALALQAAVVAPPGITVKYSTSSNPVRSDLDATVASPPGAQAGTFSTTAPTPLSNTKSLLFDFGSLVLNPGESKEILWTMSVPPAAAAGDVAWNSFGYRSEVAGSGVALQPSEPVKVGVAVPFTVGSFVWNDLNNDGVQGPGEPGIEGATLQIFKSDGSPALDVLGTPVAQVVSDSNGIYAFGALADGDYFVRVTPPGVYVPTSNQVPDPDNDADSDSNIDLSRSPPSGSFESGIFTFVGNSEPVGELGAGGTQDDVDDNDGNMTVDFGFYIESDDFGDFAGFADARSATSALIKLGTAETDAENIPVKNSAATGDDTNGTDDEDGVTFGGLYRGRTATVTLHRTNNSGAVAYLSAWVDFDNDGNLSDAGEQILSNVSVPPGTSGSIPYTFDVPSDAVLANVGARFRICSESNPPAIGPAGSGEVEDYSVRICPFMVICPEVSHLPVAAQGSAYLMPISVLGATGPFTFAVTSGSLPTGLSLNSGSGVLAGTPSVVQTSVFTITATDADGCSISWTYTLEVGVAGSIIQVQGGTGSGNVPITAASFLVNGGTNNQSSEVAGTNVAVLTDEVIDLSSLTINDGGTLKTLSVANLNGGTVVNVNLSPTEGSFGVHLNGVATSIASSGIPAFKTSAAEISTNVNLNHYIYDDRGEGEPDSLGEYDIRFNYALTVGDYIVCQERFGNSHVQLQPLDALGNPIAGARTVQVRGTHDWNTGYASSYNSSQPYFLTVIRQAIFGTTQPIYGFRVSLMGADCKFFGMSDSPFTDNPTSAGLIGDFVWLDSNQNGIQDDGEIGLGGVTVRLLDTALAVVASTTTDGAGVYSFNSIVPGDYQIEFELPLGYGLTVADQGNNEGIDSDANVSTGRTAVFTMLPCDSMTHIDAGVVGHDFGDWNGGGALTTTTSSAVNTHLRLGASVDSEAGVVPDAGATADGADEDGVTMPAALTLGENVTIPVSVFNESGADAYLNAWIDFDNDGSFDDALVTNGGERLEPTLTIVNGGATTENVTFTVPVGAAVGSLLGVRFRLVNQPGSMPTGVGGVGEIEDYVVTIYPAMGIGNLVFIDANENGAYDAGEGVQGVEVELYTASQVPELDFPEQTTMTNADGIYLFEGLSAGGYVLHIPSWEFWSGRPLHAKVSIAEGLAGDDDVGENGINSDDPELEGISSGIIVVAQGIAPTAITGETGFGSEADDDVDAAINLTVDFGFQNPVGIGNLVFVDQDNDGVFDVGEGVGGVTVELYRAAQAPGVDQPIRTTFTDGNGVYYFDHLSSGGYQVHVPAFEFGLGGLLEGMLSIPGAVLAGDDDVGENGIDVPLPSATGVSSAIANLTGDLAPTNAGEETGGFSGMDDGDDNNGDLTIDLGFRAPDPNAVGLGNLVFVDYDGNGIFDLGEGAANVTVQLFSASDDPSVDPPMAVMQTTQDGLYYFGGLSAGSYFVHIPASQFQANAPLQATESLPGSGGDFGLDDGFDENGIDAANPMLTGVSSDLIALEPDMEPTDVFGEYGLGAGIDFADDDNSDLTVDLGFFIPLSVGNLVFFDQNGNGVADPGEGVGGVTVKVYPSWADPLFDDSVGSATTDTNGHYLITGLVPGEYILHISDLEFVGAGPLVGALSLPGVSEGDDNGGEDGVDEPNPNFYGVSTGVFPLAVGAAPIGAAEGGLGGSTDDANDSNVNLTIDLGFTGVVSIGNRVFVDSNHNGLDDDSAALGGAVVELFAADGQTPVNDAAGDAVVSQLTDTSGVYGFTNLLAGTYVVRVTPPTDYLPTVYGGDADNDVDEDSNGQSVPGQVYVQSEPVNVTAGDEPIGDEDSDASSNNTVDFGFVYASVSFANWQLQNPLGGDNGPGDNPDGDRYSNLQEFVFDQSADSGIRENAGFTALLNPVTGKIDVHVTTPVALAGVTLTLQGIADLSASPSGWSALTGLASSSTVNGDGTETEIFYAVSDAPMFAASSGGNVRLKIEADTDGNATLDTTEYSEVYGWHGVQFLAQVNSFSMPYTKKEVFGGTVGAIVGNTLNLSAAVGSGSLTSVIVPGTEFYAEVVAGDTAGHRFEVDEAATTGTVLALVGSHARDTMLTVPAGLEGDQIVVRAHQLVGDLFPAGLFANTTNPATADRLLTHTGTTFETRWLYRNGTNPKWVGPVGLTDQGTRVVDPGEGVFVQPKQGAVTVWYAGQVRATPFACRLRQGLTMIGSGWPVAETPAGRIMTVPNGFTGGSTAPVADRFSIWLGDATEGAQGYQSYYKLNTGSLDRWVTTTGAITDRSTTQLFQPFRAAFMNSMQGHTAWVMPVPWTP